MMRYVLLGLLCVLVTGCARYNQPLTPEEQEAQERMAREVLQESSPRDLNGHPKVSDEFKKTFTWGGSNPKPSSTAEGSAKESAEAKKLDKRLNQGGGTHESDTPPEKEGESDEEAWW